MSAMKPGPAELEAARLVLARLGVTLADLQRDPAALPQVPTFAEYIPVVAAGATDGTRHVYGTYWSKVITHWGDRRINEPTPSDIAGLADSLRADRVVRRNARDGRGATEHLIGALRHLYRRAIADGWLPEGTNPALKVDKPRRTASSRRAIPADGLAEINRVAATTGYDPILDAILLRLHTETACRRGGALALRPRDLDREQCLILLREKGGTVRWQPVSPTLMHHLVALADDRGAEDEEPLLRGRNRRPITRRRYDRLWDRIGQHLPWVRTQQISIHWLRHTTLTWVERHFGFAIAQAFAGHDAPRGAGGVTAAYVKPTLQELCVALSELTGERHPLA